MSVRLSARRLVSSASPALTKRPLAPSSTLLPLAGPSSQVRTKWNFNPFRRKGNDDAASASMSSELEKLDDPAFRQATSERVNSSLTDSIFEDEIAETAGGRRAGPSTLVAPITAANSAFVLDPNPAARERWQRAQVVRLVRRNGRLSRAEVIERAERQLLLKSPRLPTGYKKLGMLARQVAGRPVDEAMLQMRFSKKKFAAEVRHQLAEARDRAVVERGMGLGGAAGEAAGPPRKIQDRDGKWMVVRDPTRMYVAQAWVGRGKIRAKSKDYKARGRMGVLKHPSTTISFILKEEKTRIREHDDRVARAARRKPWVHLPDRPVSAQRPYYSW